MGIAGKVTLLISQDVLDEVARNLDHKAPETVSTFTTQVATAFSGVVANLSKKDILTAAAYTALKDAPIIAAAIKAQATYLATYDRKHLLDKPNIVKKSGLIITTPDSIVKAIQQEVSAETTQSN